MAATLAEAFEEICRLEVPLAERLAAYDAKLRELNFPFAEAYDTLVARLMAGEIGKTAPAVGEVMPDFVLPERGARLLSLDELAETGPVVVSFNRGHWCPFCKIEVHTLAEHAAEISELGGHIVSIIPDKQEFAERLHHVADGKVRVVSDIDNGYALSLGLVMWLGDKLKAMMKGRGLHLDTVHGSDGWFVPLPATFVVDKKKIVRARNVDPEFRHRLDIDLILDALKKIRAET